jgi:hypothetical protein
MGFCVVKDLIKIIMVILFIFIVHMVNEYLDLGIYFTGRPG